MSDATTLMEAYLDGDISAEERRRLEAWLAEDASHRRELAQRSLDHVLIHDALQDWGGGRGAPAGQPADAAPSALARLRQLLVRPEPVSLTAALVVMTCIIATMALVAVPVYRHIARESAVETPAAERFAAELVGNHEAVWRSGPLGVRRGAKVPAGESLQLEQGLAEFLLRGGARIIVEGPAELTFDGQNEVSLKRGKLWARVTRRARGFTVFTSHARIVDHGTEFGVEVDAQGRGAVVVLEGGVAVYAAGNDDARQTPLLLTAGETATLEDNGPGAKSRQASNKGFATELPDAQLNRFVVRRWTSDTNSLISSGKAYSHKVNLRCDGPAGIVVNRVTFDDAQVPVDGPIPNGEVSGSNWSLRVRSGVTRDFARRIFEWENGQAACSQLLDDFAYVLQSLELRGLTPGQTYVLTFYASRYATAEHANVTARAGTQLTVRDTGTQFRFDQNQLIGSLLQYRYVAPDDGVLQIDADHVGATQLDHWHIYAFSNEAAPKSPSQAEE